MTEAVYPIGQKVNPPSHFAEPVVVEGSRPLGSGFEYRVRLPDGSPDETILTHAEMEALLAQSVV